MTTLFVSPVYMTDRRYRSLVTALPAGGSPGAGSISASTSTSTITNSIEEGGQQQQTGEQPLHGTSTIASRKRSMCEDERAQRIHDYVKNTLFKRIKFVNNH